MNKLFIFSETEGSYSKELHCAYKQVAEEVTSIKESELTADYLMENNVQVVISNGLTTEQYLMLKALNIVSVTIDDLNKYDRHADIVIDHSSDNRTKYFTGSEFSACKNKDFGIAEVTDLIKKLKWDSDFFGFTVAFVSSKILTESVSYHIEKYIEENNIKLTQYLCDCHDRGSVRMAEKFGYHFVDIRLSFEQKLEKLIPSTLNEGYAFGIATESDIEDLKKIAHHIYVDSRYYFDGNFSRDKIDQFFGNWVEKGVKGAFDDECCVIYHNDKAIGFCTIEYNIEKTANIGLFGISQEYRGKNVGLNLLYSTFGYLKEKGYTNLNVVTQGRNYGAQRLYQKAGFLTKKTELWYHKWR